MFVIGFAVSLIFCFIIASMAKERGRSGLAFFLLSAVLTPIIGLIVLLLMGKADPSLDRIEHIYWCSSCDSAYSDTNNHNAQCPTCKITLTETTISAVDWRKQSEGGKTALRQAFARGEYLRNDNSITAPANIDNISSISINATIKNEANNNSVYDELKKYKELLDSGAITQDEYEVLKNKVLNK